MASKLKNAEYSEDTVAIAIDSFLTALTFPFTRFSLELFTKTQERRMGADARLISHRGGFLPIYMQFKRPSAYPEDSRSSIIRDRKDLAPPLETSPNTLFFALRRKEPDHADYQHNILYKLRQALHFLGKGDAFYVCPLFLDRSAYRFHVHISALRRWFQPWLHPFDLGNYNLSFGDQVRLIEEIPIFKKHVSITPHAPVDNHRHKYSFTEQGKEICFHSPLHVEKGFESFGTSLANNIRASYNITDRHSSSEMTDLLRGIINRGEIGFELDERKLLEEYGWIDQWLQLGDFLLSEYSIYQYALYFHR